MIAAQSMPASMSILTPSRVAALAFAAALLVLACGASAATLAGRVVAVHDGDTITLLIDRREVRVRLAGIDAPERGQPYASASRKALASRIAGREVGIDKRGQDAFGRTLGVVIIDGVDVNRAQVADGWAWVFRRYTNDPSLRAAENEARSGRRGLWAGAHPVPPWAWRERQATRTPVAAAR